MGLLPLFLSQISKKLGPRRPVFGRLFSSLSSKTPYLCLRDEIVSVIYGEDEYTLAGSVVDTRVFDARKEETVTLPDRIQSSQLFGATPIGSSRGWLALSHGVDKPSILLTNKSDDRQEYDSYARLARLPCPGDLPECVVNVSLSSSSPEDDDDCLLAVKFLGGRISFCRPALGEEAQWSNAYTPEDHFYTSSIVYSNRHRKFFMTTQGSQYLAAWDLHTYPSAGATNFHNSCLTPLRISNQPDFPPSIAKLMLSCFTTHYLVESPSDECEFFHVTGYFQTSHDDARALVFNCLAHNAKRFTVFKQSNSEMSYTEDIGDLCIFVGKNESFCLSSAAYPGLRPNSIYFVGLASGPNAGVYDIAAGTIHHFPLDRLESPHFWCAPLV